MTCATCVFAIRIYSIPDTDAAFSSWAFPLCRYVTAAGWQTSTQRCPWWSRKLQRSSCGPDQRRRSAFRDFKDFIKKSPQTHCSLPYLVDEGFEEVGLVSERVMHQPVAEGDDAVRKVVLREPSHHTLLLHIRTTRHVYNQIAQILPESARNERINGATLKWHHHCSFTAVRLPTHSWI